MQASKMLKKMLYLFPLFFLLAACVARPVPLATIAPTTALSTTAIKPPLRTASPQPTAIGTSLPGNATITNIPTNIPESVDDLIQVLYASDPDLSQYDPHSLSYAQFPDALEQLSGMGSMAIDAAPLIAHAISFPRQEANLAAKTLITIGPEITATTIPVLIDNLYSQRSNSRLYSVIVLGTVKEKASCAAGDIGPLLWDSDPEVRFASAFALENITGNDLLPNAIDVNPDPLSTGAILADIPEGKIVKQARDWWTEEGSKVNWHPTYGICDP